uniref:Uncharacterized protein n=1 Tax=Burkholderia cenocepacia TaxID=95486 RepID=A0A071MEA0_9BURK
MCGKKPCGLGFLLPANPCRCEIHTLTLFLRSTPGLITMSMRELDRLKVVEAVVEQRLMPWRAAERLGISRRQIKRLVARYRAAGPAGPIFPA